MKFGDDTTRLPHILEQEVFSLSQILEMSLKLYHNFKTSEMQLFSESWVHRYVC